MPVTIEQLENNIKTLPENLYQQVNDFVDFLRERYTDCEEIPKWQADESAKRVQYLQENPESTVSEGEMKSFINTLRK